jgi:hypothetical protein
MSQVLLVWSFFLTVLTALNLMLCLAIIRRLKTPGQHEHDQLPDLLEPGAVVGDFTAHTLDGSPVSTKSLDGPTLVAFVMSGCEPCATVVAELRGREQREKTVFFVLDNGPDSDALTYAASLLDLGDVVLSAPESPVERAFGGMSGYPALFRVNGGKVTSASRRLTSLAGAPQPVPA